MKSLKGSANMFWRSALNLSVAAQVEIESKA
jgi:hypothetical protein